MKKHLRRCLCSALAVLLMVSMLPAASAAQTDHGDAYKAYYDYLLEEVNSLGTAVRDEDYYNMFTNNLKRPAITEKLLAVHLVDVTGDGLEELIIKRYVTHTSSEVLDSSDTEWICIYSYMDGQIKRIGQNKRWMDRENGSIWNSYSPPGYIGEILSSWQFPYISDNSLIVCKGANGKTYVSDAEPSTSSDGFFGFFAFNGTHMEEVDRFWVNWVPDWIYGSVHSNYGTNSYWINNQKVSLSTFRSRYNRYISGGTQVLSNNDYNTVLNTLYNIVAAEYLPSSWAAAGVNEALSMGFVPKSLQKNYNNPITRAEFCQLAANYYEITTGQTITALATFNDTDSEAVRKMGGLGVITGTGGGNFSPNALLTREQAAVILVSLGKALGSTLLEAAPTFADNDQISSWALARVGTAQAAGIMSGTDGGKFSPQSAYTREQSILTLMRMSTAAQPDVTDVEMDDDRVQLMPTGSVTLTATAYNKKDAVRQIFTWTSSDPEVATVDSTGTVTAISGGKTTITAIAGNGESAKCTVTVHDLIGGVFYLEDEVFDATYRMASGDEEKGEVEVVELEVSTNFSSVASASVDIAAVEAMGDYDIDTTREILLKWEAYDANDNLLASGEESESTKVGIVKEGKKFHFLLVIERPQNYEGPIRLVLD